MELVEAQSFLKILVCCMDGIKANLWMAYTGIMGMDNDTYIASMEIKKTEIKI